MQNSKESKGKPEKKELRCPFSKDLKCEDCRLYQFQSKGIGKVCVLIYIAMRSE